MIDDDNFYGHLLTGRTADRRYLAWVQTGNPWRQLDGWWTGDEALIDAARRERGLLRDPDDVALMALVVVRVLGDNGKPDRWTRMVAALAARREQQLARERDGDSDPFPWTDSARWTPPTDGS